MIEFDKALIKERNDRELLDKIAREKN